MLWSKKYTTASDVWSFGILLHEIYTDCASKPYCDFTPQRMIFWVAAGNRMPQPAECPDDMYSTMLRCWHETSSARPSFKDLISIINKTWSNSLVAVPLVPESDNLAVPQDQDADGRLDPPLYENASLFENACVLVEHTDAQHTADNAQKKPLPRPRPPQTLLPAGFTCARDPGTGWTVYINHNNNTTSFTAPRGTTSALSHGASAGVDDDGRIQLQQQQQQQQQPPPSASTQEQNG